MEIGRCSIHLIVYFVIATSIFCFLFFCFRTIFFLITCHIEYLVEVFSVAASNNISGGFACYVQCSKACVLASHAVYIVSRTNNIQPWRYKEPTEGSVLGSSWFSPLIFKRWIAELSSQKSVPLSWKRLIQTNFSQSQHWPTGVTLVSTKAGSHCCNLPLDPEVEEVEWQGGEVTSTEGNSMVVTALLSELGVFLAKRIIKKNKEWHWSCFLVEKMFRSTPHLLWQKFSETHVMKPSHQ